MRIKFYCDKHCLDFKKTEEELQTERAITHCPFCGDKLHILNLNDIVATDIEIKVKNNIDKWGKELGLEGCIELVERNSNYAISRLYHQELKRRGWIK